MTSSFEARTNGLFRSILIFPLESIFLWTSDLLLGRPFPYYCKASISFVTFITTSVAVVLYSYQQTVHVYAGPQHTVITYWGPAPSPYIGSIQRSSLLPVSSWICGIISVSYARYCEFDKFCRFYRIHYGKTRLNKLIHLIKPRKYVKLPFFANISIELVTVQLTQLLLVIIESRNSLRQRKVTWCIESTDCCCSQLCIQQFLDMENTTLTKLAMFDFAELIVEKILPSVLLQICL